MSKYWVGITPQYKRELFISNKKPTVAAFGDLYNYVIGPFYTKLAAELMQKHGENNPHLQHTSYAEKLAKKGRVALRKEGFNV
jgi:hypothetical protein